MIAEDYVDLIEGKIQELNSHEGCMWVRQFDKELSDHRYICHNMKGHAVVGSWNIWNPRYAKYITPSTGSNQGLGHCWFVQPENREERENKVLEKVLDHIKRGEVLCLQEVWPEFRDRLAALKKELGFEVLETFKDEHNMNLVCYDVSWFDHLQTIPLLRQPEWSEQTDAFVLMPRHREGTHPFVVVNVHVKFGKNRALFEAVHAARESGVLSKTAPTVVCGDFNCSARRTPPVEGDHISLLDEVLKDARLAPPNPPYYTHCNTRANAGSIARQLDAFDHFVLF